MVKNQTNKIIFIKRIEKCHIGKSVTNMGSRLEIEM